MTKNVKLSIIAGVVISAVIIAGVILYAYNTNKQLAEFTQQYELEKEALEEEYSQLAIQYEGYKLNVNNDSLADKLENERQKVQRLVEELKTTKATNALRINELKKELSTVRGVLRSYVAQVDSLNRVNEELEKENKRVKQQYQAASQSAQELKKQKEVLTQQVSRAAKLDAVAIKVEALNKRQKATDKISRAEKIRVSFQIAKNITAEPGEKEIYFRIMQPDGDVLIKNYSNVFEYENSKINYSMRRLIEYTGEEMEVTAYWDIEEVLFPGEYRVDIFADGNMIGKKSFKLEK